MLPGIEALHRAGFSVDPVRFSRRTGIERLPGLANRHTMIQQRDHLLNQCHVSHAVQTMTLGGAEGLDQVITPFPGPQGHRVDARQARHRADRHQSLLRQTGMTVDRFHHLTNLQRWIMHSGRSGFLYKKHT